MASRRMNMSRRKPVPKYLLEPSSAPSHPSRPNGTIRKLSLRIINKEVPPLPHDWRETIDYALKKERRCAVYIATPGPPPPPKDDDVCSAITLVEEEREQEDATFAVPPQSQSECAPIECVEEIQATTTIVSKVSQKALPTIYRSPTPPLPATHPKLRPATHSRASSESLTHTLYPGQTTSELLEATPCPSMLTVWPNLLGTDVSMTAHSPDSRSRVLSFNSNDLPKQRGEASRRARRRSAASTSVSTGNRSCSRRSSQMTACHMCDSVWYALKALGLHLRAKLTHRTKY